MKFTYHNNSNRKWELQPDGHGHWVPEVLFEVEAPSITAADKLYKEKTGNDPVKQPYVSVAINKC